MIKNKFLKKKNFPQKSPVVKANNNQQNFFEKHLKQLDASLDV